MRTVKTSGIRVSLLLSGCIVILFFFFPSPLPAQNIVDEWQTVKAPSAPELKPVTIDFKVTALLMLDFNKQTCNPERRPRCISSIPSVEKLLKYARDKGVFVVYSLSAGAAPADIAKELAPLGNEPVVASGPDKFLGTDLEKILKEKNIKTVIAVGTAAHGAVLYTASGAALRDMQVIVAVDGISAESLYAEQSAAWILANAPRISANVTLTKIELIK
jgi:nicotinamidase-related amidase